MMNAAKQMEMFGLWKRQSDSWIFDKPRMFDEAGNVIELDAPSLSSIAQMVDGDTQGFGEFLIAARSIEMHGPRFAGRRGTPPLDIATAQMIYANAPERYHQAQKEALRYARALADVSVQAGIISPELRAQYEDDIFYVPLVRLFGGEPGSLKGGAGVGRGKIAKGVLAGTTHKRFTKSDRKVRNGFEALLENTPRVLRNAEFNRMAVQLTNMVEELRRGGNKELASYIATPLATKDLKTSARAHDQIEALRMALEDMGVEIGSAEAERIAAQFGIEQVNVTDGTLTLFRDGKMERWRIHEDIATAMRALNADEFSMLLRVIGFPARLARVGITASPRFIFWQAFRDNFQLWLNSPEWFGFIPFVDQARGWFHAVTASPEYKKAVSAGLTGESLTAEGIRAVRSKYSRERSILEDVRVGKGQSAIQKLAANVKNMSVRELYADLVMPIADAARIGAYLRARGRGMSVLDAVYRAKRVGVNYGQRGHSRFINNLNYMTLFLNPSLQSIDESARAFRRNPIKYLTKAFVGITLPSLYFWFEYKDDDEIQELRRTESGRRYWWLRDLDGRIRRIPKPILDGQLWGASVESWLDKTKLEDPVAIETWYRAMSEDAAIHLLPTWFAVPFGIAGNWNLTFGGPITPESTERLDPEMRYSRSTTDAARIAGKFVAPASRFFQDVGMETAARALSPAAIDFIVRNALGGEVGHELMKAVGQAARYASDPGYSIEKDEAPFIASIYPRFPTTGAQSLREFYKFARLAEQHSATFMAKLNANPEEGIQYYMDNRNIIDLLDVYKDARADLVDLRAAIVDIEEMDGLTSKDRREITDTLIEVMIETARNINTVTRSMMRITANEVTK
jgi:hypothetical protein